MSTPPRILVHDREDNVGVVVVEDLRAGEDALCAVTADDSAFSLKTLDDVPLGHKVALVDLKSGEAACKYGENIGVMTQDAQKGAHVHVHNLKTGRW